MNLLQVPQRKKSEWKFALNAIHFIQVARNYCLKQAVELRNLIKNMAENNINGQKGGVYSISRLFLYHEMYL